MSDINTELSGGILRVELNRPDKKNAMTNGMYVELADILRSAAKDDAVHVVLLHGAGNDFSAGNDVGDFLNHPPAAGESPQAKLVEALIAFEKPIVAAVRGVAVGGGTTMLTHCDFVYAGENTRFQTPFVNLALVPEYGSSFTIPLRAGHLGAAELFLLGEPFGAARAAELGLVSRIFPDAEVLAAATAIAEKLATKPSGALQASKRLIKRAFLDHLRASVEAEAQEFIARLRSAEAKEAFSAFLEKRPPNFAKAA